MIKLDREKIFQTMNQMNKRNKRSIFWQKKCMNEKTTKSIKKGEKYRNILEKI